MINNDEWVFYTEEEMSWQRLLKCLTFGAFDSPYLRVSRPVYNVEVKDGLRVKANIVIQRLQEKAPEVTSLLDTIHFILDEISWRRKVCDGESEATKSKVLDPSWVLAHMIAYNCYDCMSDGVPPYLIPIARYFMENYSSINWDTYVYPAPEDSGKDHYTLRDFYEMTRNAIDITPQLKRLPKGLLALPSGG